MDLSEEVLFAQAEPMCSHINIGTGVDCTIRELAETLAEVTGFSGKLVFDASKPNGMPRTLLDISPLNALGWKLRICLREDFNPHMIRSCNISVRLEVYLPASRSAAPASRLKSKSAAPTVVAKKECLVGGVSSLPG